MVSPASWGRIRNINNSRMNTGDSLIYPQQNLR